MKWSKDRDFIVIGFKSNIEKKNLHDYVVNGFRFSLQSNSSNKRKLFYKVLHCLQQPKATEI